MIMAVLEDNGEVKAYHIKHYDDSFAFYPEDICTCKDNTPCYGYCDVIDTNKHRFISCSGINSSVKFKEIK